jgi:UDP-N-acetylmuramoylalanine--D-glutamate ligase
MKLNQKIIKNKNIHVVGISGMEGWAAARFLTNLGANIIGHDFVSKLELKNNFYSLRDYLSNEEKDQEWKKFSDLKNEINLEDSYLDKIEEADLIFVPQSWFRYSFNNKLDKSKYKEKFITILDLYFSFSPCKIIGITGSSGKSTTSRLVDKIINQGGIKSFLSGNDRENPPVLDKLKSLDSKDFLVLEISNRQLIDFNHSPFIGLITNIFPTHLDDHGDLAAYKYAKQNLIRSQKKGQYSILNYDDNQVLDLELATGADIYYFSTKKNVSRGCYIKEGKVYYSGEKRPIFDLEKVKLPGIHNQANAMAAACVGKILNISNDSIAKTVYNFKGLKHRIEFVGSNNQLSFYNDSQSTNPLSTVAAFKSFNKPTHLIIGGKNKPNPKDFSILAEEILESQIVKKVYLIGESSGQILTQFRKIADNQELKKLGLEKYSNLNQAFKKIISQAKPQEVVLLSPACESFGEFDDYRDRGNKFVKMVNEFTNQ